MVIDRLLADGLAACEHYKCITLRSSLVMFAVGNSSHPEPFRNRVLAIVLEIPSNAPRGMGFKKRSINTARAGLRIGVRR